MSLYLDLADALLEAFLSWVAEHLPPPQRPDALSVTLLREEADMLVYGLALPPTGAPDVTRRVLTQVVNGASSTLDATDGMELSYNQGDTVVLSLVDIDDAGLGSAPSDPLSFTATDTIAPPQPGALGVNLLREE